MTTQTPARDVLTQVDAEDRFARVANVTYDLQIDLTQGSETYGGEAVLRFDLRGTGDTFLDFRGKTIERLEVNGREVQPDWTGYRLTLPGGALLPSNTVRIHYENNYDRDGDGLHIFRDPEDGQEYVYSNFEPYEAHRLFPCFDQPDIKARYSLTVTAPAEWEVVTNSRETEATRTEAGSIRHTYETTALFSTYLVALIAGPYHAFRDTHNDIPIGFFCRKSLVKYVDIDELFAVTKQGLDFFAEFFDYPYPFTKYDQVFVPEFNAGAMENVGAITHAEFMVFRDPPTDNQRLDRAEIILHEMAHMWFGDLVTMKWWNDLWLNESFASYMAYLSASEATRFTTAWQEFNRGMKAWAYREDQLTTTHPIATQVPDTDQTRQNFDGITYGKGASVIKQLVQAIGMDGFREGMRRYFKRHAWGNTTLAQFLDSLEEGSGRDLHAWAELWLEKPSLNTIAASYELDGKRVTGLTLAQTAPEDHRTIRPHSMEVALGRDEGGTILIESIPAEIDGEEAEIEAAVGRVAPDFVFPNYNDHDFAKVSLDAASLEFFKARLERIDDAFLRQLIWQALWNMVRDQQLKSTEYLELVGAKAPGERDPQLVESILNTATTAAGRFVPEDRRDAAAHALSDVAWAALQAAPQGDLQIIWARTLINVALTPEDILRTGTLADGAVTIPGLEIDQDMRWEIAARFTAYGLPGAAERAAGERARDASDRGQRAMLRIEVAAPDPAVKADAWRKFHDEGYGSLQLTAAAMRGFQWRIQRDILEPYVERFFDAVPGIYETRDLEFAGRYSMSLFPGFEYAGRNAMAHIPGNRVESPILDRSRGVIEEHGDRLPLLRRSLMEINDDLERAIKCRAFAES